MPVLLNGKRRLPPKPRGNRGLGTDREIANIADLIIEAQSAGHIAPREVASFLNSLPEPTRTRERYTASSIRRMLARGVELGFVFHRQTRAEAGARPRNPRRTRDQIEREMSERRLASRMRALAAAEGLCGMAITAAKRSTPESVNDE